MKTICRLLMMLTLSISIWTSCESHNMDRANNADNETAIDEAEYGNGEIVLGEKLSNPYSLKNMQRALDAIIATRGADSTKLMPTDLYVRFRPTDTTEYRLLMEQNLELFDYPLDYDILVEGDYYHDPSIAQDEITWQYTVIPANSPAINIKYEKIDIDLEDYAETQPEFEIIVDSSQFIGGQILDA